MTASVLLSIDRPYLSLLNGSHLVRGKAERQSERLNEGGAGKGLTDSLPAYSCASIDRDPRGVRPLFSDALACITTSAQMMTQRFLKLTTFHLYADQELRQGMSAQGTD